MHREFNRAISRLVKLCCCLWLSGLALSVHGATVVEVEAVIEQSEQALQKARAAEHAWNVTETYLLEAREKLVEQELDAAMEAAQHALLTANKAVEQATAERSAWQARVPAL